MIYRGNTGVLMMNKLIDKKQLIIMGLKPYTAETVIREAKTKMVQLGYPFYQNRKLATVPKKIVEEILGIPITEADDEIHQDEIS